MNILHMSITAAVFILAVVVIRFFGLTKLPKSTFGVLWAIAAVRLLIPLDVSSPLSIYNITAYFTAWIKPTPEAAGLGYALGHADTDINGVQAVLQTASALSGVSEVKISVSLPPLTLIWLTGFAAMLIYMSIAFYKVHKKLFLAYRIDRNEIIDEWRKQNKMMRRIEILQSDRITTPLSIGIFRPRIILPTSMNMNDTTLIQYVLTHEAVHLKRFDMFWKMLLNLCLCIHWFNPAVWLMIVLAHRDMEITCDEKVVNIFGTENKAVYALSLISMAEKKSRFTLIYNGFSLNGAEERITLIMKIKKNSITGIVIACLIVAVVTTACATSAVDKQPEDLPKEDSKDISEKVTDEFPEEVSEDAVPEIPETEEQEEQNDISSDEENRGQFQIMFSLDNKETWMTYEEAEKYLSAEDLEDLNMLNSDFVWSYGENLYRTISPEMEAEMIANETLYDTGAVYSFFTMQKAKSEDGKIFYYMLQIPIENIVSSK